LTGSVDLKHELVEYMHHFLNARSSTIGKAFLAFGLVLASVGFTQASPLPVKDMKVGDKVVFTDKEGTIGGGEYEVKNLTDPSKKLFRTFCVERNESLDFSSAGFIVKEISTKTSSGKELDSKAACLYWSFRKGTLAGYDYTPGSSDHVKSANALQAALWLIQKESGYNLDNWWSDDTFQALPNSVKNKAYAFKNLAAAAISSGSWTGLGLVRVAQMVYTDRYTVDKRGKKKYSHREGDPAQDVLILIPEPASIVFWLTAGSLAGIGAVVRRRKEAIAV
jgi:hypothetical protein